MKALLALVLVSLPLTAFSQGTPCYWSGQLTKCFPTTGIYLDNSRSLRLGTDNTTNYVELKAANSMGSNYTLTLPATQGSNHTTLHDDGSGGLTWALITLTTDVTGILPIANGGTNSSTALNNNRVMQSSGGAVVEASAIIASRALASDANGIPVASATTATELGYVSGVTSAIQTQLDGKASTALGNLASTAVNASVNPASDDTVDLGSTSKTWHSLDIRTGGVNYLTDTGTNAVQTVAPSGMSGSYTLTWPSNASGNVGYLLTDASGTGTLGWSAPGISSATMYTEFDAQETNRPADIACVSNITLSGSQTCDGQSSFGAFSALVMGQTDPTEDGWYFTNAFGAWTRLTGSSGIASIPGQLFCVTASGGGTNYSDTCWIGGGDGSSTATFALLPRSGAGSHTNLTASRALVTDASGHLTSATTTATEIGYVNGVTSAIQTQLGTKTTNPMTTTGDIIYASNTATPATAARLAVGGANTVLHGGASVPAYSAVADADLTGQVGVAHGGTGIASGTSGGIPYFSGTTTIASSSLLTNHAVMIGAGAAAAPKTISAGTDGQLLVGVTSGDPAFGNTVSTLTNFTGGYRGNTPFIYHFTGVTNPGATPVAFTDGAVDVSGDNITQGFASSKSTFTFGSAGWYQVILDANTDHVSIANSYTEIAMTLSGSATRYVNNNSDVIEFISQSGNSDNEKHTGIVMVNATASQTIAIAPTCLVSTGNGTCQLQVFILPL